LTGLDWSVLQIKLKIVSRHTADYKPVKQEVNGAVMHPPLVFPAPQIFLVGSAWGYFFSHPKTFFQPQPNF